MALSGSSTARAPSTSTGGRFGRFTVSPHTAPEEEAGSDVATTATPPPAVAVANDLSGVSGAATPVDPVMDTNGLASMSKLEEIIEAQQSFVTAMWEDMKTQVYQALLQNGNGTTVPQQATRPTTPTSTYSTSSCTSRTPPCTNGGGSEQRARRPNAVCDAISNYSSVPGAPSHSSSGFLSAQGSLAGGWPSASPAAPSVAPWEANEREKTLKSWSQLGSTLQKVVKQNLDLEEENRRLRQDIQMLNQKVTAAQQALAASPPAPAAAATAAGLRAVGTGLNSVTVSHGGSVASESCPSPESPQASPCIDFDLCADGISPPLQDAVLGAAPDDLSLVVAAAAALERPPS